MTDQPGWTTPGPGVPPGWSPRQPPPAPPLAWGPPGPDWTPPPGSVPPGMGPPGAGWRPYGPKPGVIPLRPLALGEILDGAVSYIRRNPRATLGLSAIVTAIAQVIQLIVMALLLRDVSQLRPEDIESFTGPLDVFDAFASSLVAYLFGTVVSLIATLALTGMLTAVVGRAVLGQQATMGEAWREARPRLLPLLGVSLLTTLLVIAAVLVPLVPGVLAAVAGAPTAVTVILVVMGVFGVIAAGVWVYVTFALATPAVVLERAGVIAALGRSRALTRHGFWRVFGILLLAGLIAGILGSVLQVPFILVGEVLLGSGIAGGGVMSTTVVAGMIVGALGGILAGTIVHPFSAGVSALLYVDQRMRREGLDLELQAAAGVSGPPGSGYPGQPGQPGHPGQHGYPSERPGPPDPPPPQGW